VADVPTVSVRPAPGTAACAERDHFDPMEAIPTAVNLTTYDGGAEDFMVTPLEELLHQIATGKLHVQIGKTIYLDQDCRGLSLHRGTDREQRKFLSSRPSPPPLRRVLRPN
jgi:hypothetical protein